MLTFRSQTPPKEDFKVSQNIPVPQFGRGAAGRDQSSPGCRALTGLGLVGWCFFNLPVGSVSPDGHRQQGAVSGGAVPSEEGPYTGPVSGAPRQGRAGPALLAPGSAAPASPGHELCRWEHAERR